MQAGRRWYTPPTANATLSRNATLKLTSVFRGSVDGLNNEGTGGPGSRASFARAADGPGESQGTLRRKTTASANAPSTPTRTSSGSPSEQPSPSPTPSPQGRPVPTSAGLDGVADAQLESPDGSVVSPDSAAAVGSP